MLTPRTLDGLGCRLLERADHDLTGVGGVPLPANGTGASELSGITWAGGTQYYAIADGGAGLFPVSVTIDPTTGAITSAALSAKIQLAAGSDLEGVVYDTSSNTVYASDETGPAIRQYAVANETPIAPAAILHGSCSEHDECQATQCFCVRQAIQRQLRTPWPARRSIEPLPLCMRVAQFVIDQQMPAVCKLVDAIGLQCDR